MISDTRTVGQPQSRLKPSEETTEHDQQPNKNSDRVTPCGVTRTELADPNQRQVGTGTTPCPRCVSDAPS